MIDGTGRAEKWKGQQKKSGKDLRSIEVHGSRFFSLFFYLCCGLGVALSHPHSHSFVTPLAVPGSTAIFILILYIYIYVMQNGLYAQCTGLMALFILFIIMCTCLMRILKLY